MMKLGNNHFSGHSFWLIQKVRKPFSNFITLMLNTEAKNKHKLYRIWPAASLIIPCHWFTIRMHQQCQASKNIWARAVLDQLRLGVWCTLHSIQASEKAAAKLCINMGPLPPQPPVLRVQSATMRSPSFLFCFISLLYWKKPLYSFSDIESF